jgi:hypothetical protein
MKGPALVLGITLAAFPISHEWIMAVLIPFALKVFLQTADAIVRFQLSMLALGAAILAVCAIWQTADGWLRARWPGLDTGTLGAGLSSWPR